MSAGSFVSLLEGASVDVSEILLISENRSFVIHYLQRVFNIPGGCLGFLNHQQ